MRTFLTLEEAWAQTLADATLAGAEEVPLDEAYGRRLAVEIRSQAPIPPFDRSMLDGYAVRAMDLIGASPSNPVVLDVIEHVPAGHVPQETVGTGQASRIMTGAAMPVGSDAVLRLEATQTELDGKRVHGMMAVPVGEAISPQGEDAPQGALLLRAGCVIGAAETAVLATNGDAVVTVYRRPRIGLITSGEEVRPLTGLLEPGQIRDSNGPMLAAMVRDCGGEPVPYGVVGDNMEDTVRLVGQAAQECDLVLTTGGVSVGDHDLMRDAYLQAGGQVHFWKVQMRPGTPVTYAEVGGTPVFGLSGNPAAAFVNFLLLVIPVIRKMAGEPAPEHRPLQVILANPLDAKVIGLDRFLRAKLTLTDGVLQASVPSKGQKAGIMTSLVGTHGLVRIPGGTEPKQGELVDVFLVPGQGSWR